MGNEIARRQDTLPGLVPEAEVWRIAESFRVTELEHGEKFVDRLPTAAEREALGRRKSVLDALVAKAFETDDFRRDDLTQTKMGLALAGMFGRYPSMRNANVEEQVKLYLADLCDAPTFAIVQAIEDVRHNLVFDVDRIYGKRTPLNMDHPPSSVRIRAAAEKHLVAAWEEKIKIDRVLTLPALPPPLPEAKQRELREGLQEVARHIDMTNVADAEKAAARRRENLERGRRGDEAKIERSWEDKGRPPMRAGSFLVSPELAENNRRWLEDQARRESEDRDREERKREEMATGAVYAAKKKKARSK